MDNKFEKANNIIKDFGQEHLLQFYDKLKSVEKNSILDEILSIDFSNLTNLFNNAVKSNSEDDYSNVQPITSEKWDTIPKEDKDFYYNTGLKLLSKGKVGVLVVAGGQGSRLGHEGPKGTYDIGLPSRKSLFQLQAERLLAISEKVKKVIPWYIMTSPNNHEQTISFFEENNYFNYSKRDILIFQQKVIPAVDLEGKILMKSHSEICFVPNGNGGCFSSLKEAGGIENIINRGIEWLFYYNIDNALIKVADPGFIGYSYQKGNDVASKVIEKSYPEEKVGSFCLKNGRAEVIEYSNFITGVENIKAKNDSTLFSNANISVHLFKVDFVKSMSEISLPYRVAKKEIKSISGLKKAYKFEHFIFDTFSYVEEMTFLSVDRVEEFAPIKNKQGNDSPETAKNALLNLHKKWLLESGVPLNLLKGKTIEISPLTSYEGEGLILEQLISKLNQVETEIVI